MLPDNSPKGLGNAGMYIRKALKFYDMKNERITPIIFIVILLVGFSGAFLPESTNILDSTNIIYNVIALIISFSASSIYLNAYIKELKGESCTVGERASDVFKKLPKLITAAVFLALLTGIGLVLLVIPGIIIYLMFMFNTCFILDKGSGILKSLSQSKEASKGKKTDIFVILLLFNLILFVPLFIIIVFAFSSGNELVYLFVIAFVSTVANLMQQRLMALIYRDIMYGQDFKKSEEGQVL
jgi:hypothetical protein